MFKGSFTALITPFKNKRLDKNAFVRLINHQIENGTNGIVPGGTTGESPTLSHAEHREIIKIAVKETKGKIPVMAGTGSNSTEEAIHLTKFAEKGGQFNIMDGVEIKEEHARKWEAYFKQEEQ